METTSTLITQLVEAIYSELRAGRPLPARIEQPPETFSQFQSEHRAALADVLPGADNVYPGSQAGVPVVEMHAAGAALISPSGLRVALQVSTD